LHVIFLHQLLLSCVLAVRTNEIGRVKSDDARVARSVALEDQSGGLDARPARSSVVPFSRMLVLRSRSRFSSEPQAKRVIPHVGKKRAPCSSHLSVSGVSGRRVPSFARRPAAGQFHDVSRTRDSPFSAVANSSTNNAVLRDCALLTGWIAKKVAGSGSNGSSTVTSRPAVM
jgi:hypothetical protein